MLENPGRSSAVIGTVWAIPFSIVPAWLAMARQLMISCWAVRPRGPGPLAGLTVESAMRDGAGVPGEGVPVGAPPAPDVSAADISRLVAALCGGSDHHEGAASEHAPEAAALGPVAGAAVRALCLGELDIGAHRSICLRGLRVTGRLDLSDARLELPVSFIDCEFDGVIDLTDARVMRAIRLQRCRLGSLVGDRMRAADDLVIQDGQMKGTLSLVQMQSAGTLRCSGTFIEPSGDAAAVDGLGMRVAGSVLLDRGFHARGEIRLTSAHVDGDLSLNGAVCRNPGSFSINASWLVVGGELLCQEGFSADGEVFLQWAQLRALRATGATFTNERGKAINADGARVATGVFLDRGMTARGQISLIEAKLDGELNCTGSTLEAPGGWALNATRFETREVYLNDGFKAEGAVLLGGAKISGQLVCTDGRFRNQGGCALDLGGLTCDGDVFLNKGLDGDGFHADGQVRLRRATIQRELNCSDGTFTDLGPFADPDRPRALDAASLAAGSVYLNGGFHAYGEVFLFRSNIAQQLDCAAATIENPCGTALDLSGAHVSGDIRLISGFRAVGEVRLSNAFVGQHLDCEQSQFEVGRSGKVLDASGLQVVGSFIWLPDKPPAGCMDLSSASVGRLVDDPDKWPAKQHELTGFSYASLAKPAFDGKPNRRLTWLAEAKTYSLQAYQQLATVCRQQGLEKDARRVALEKYRQRRKRKLLPWWSRSWSWFQEVTVGYGYRLYNALFIVIALGIIGTILFYYAQHHNFMLATGANPPGSVHADQCTKNYPCFTPSVYAFQLLLPVVNLHQTDFWLPNLFTGFGAVLLIYTCFAIVLGWLLGVAVVAGLGRVFSRD
jgi:hypothetical protein